MMKMMMMTMTMMMMMMMIEREKMRRKEVKAIDLSLQMTTKASTFKMKRRKLLQLLKMRRLVEIPLH